MLGAAGSGSLVLHSLLLPLAPVKTALLVLLAPTVALSGAWTPSLPPNAPVPDVRSVGAGVDLVNWESPHVHPLDITPDGSKLLAVNTAGASLEVFDLTCPLPRLLFSVPVGLDPVTVRARDNREVWVVNHVSDSVNVVDLESRNVVRTLQTEDEPCDVVFAGVPERAWVSCSQTNSVLAFRLDDLSAPPLRVAIEGEEPRALAVSADRTTVYAAIFESGNRTTILGGGMAVTNVFPPNVVSDRDGPYGGVNPPPNAADGFEPPLALDLPPPPAVSLIVRQGTDGAWRDDNGTDWSAFVDGPQASRSGRVPDWELLDHDLALIDTAGASVSYARHFMNQCMALAVHPVDGRVFVAGLEATNEVRFEPNLNGTFVRATGALFDPSGAVKTTIQDLNPHLDYTSSSVVPKLRERSLGDPRGAAWNATGSRLWVVGRGSNNVVPFDAAGQRGGAPIDVGEGPTGIGYDALRRRLYVLNHFEGTISVIEADSGVELARRPFFDPTPEVVRKGRKHNYDTHATSGLGQASCASCHTDARTDRLAWDLGNPAGSMSPVDGQNLGANLPFMSVGFEDFHPMKGPMTTQTLQDIIGKEPLHWRGDKDGIEDFNGAFTNLQGADRGLTESEMQELEDYLATIALPPNPYRAFHNHLSRSVELGSSASTDGSLPTGDAQRGLELFLPPNLLFAGAVACATCHVLPIGIGTDWSNVGPGRLEQLPAGENGERHHMLSALAGATNVSMKVPQLRTLYEKSGFDLSGPSLVGFGFRHDGTVDTLERFLEPFGLASDQDTADLIAFLLSFSGSELPAGSASDPFHPPGTPSLDTHAAVGTQLTLADGPGASAKDLSRIQMMLTVSDAGKAGVIVKGLEEGEPRGWLHLGRFQFQSDRDGETWSLGQLRGSSVAGSEKTFLIVPSGTELQLGIDRDLDGVLDGDATRPPLVDCYRDARPRRR